MSAPPSKPICPECGSDNIAFPGSCSYHYSRGKWRVISGSVTLSESADTFHCGTCGAHLDGQFEPPFNFTVQPPPFRWQHEPKPSNKTA